MHTSKRYLNVSAIVFAVLILLFSAQPSSAQSGGTLHGKVTLEDSGKPLHDVVVTIGQLKRSVQTSDDGTFEFKDVLPGTYDVVAHLDRVPDVVQSVKVTSGADATTDFLMRLRIVGDAVTVTATGDEEAAFKVIQSVTTLDSNEISEKNTQSLGDVLDHELGIAKRSFGPGNGRPVIRGFDGNRVLVLQNGQSIGALGYQSGDHTEPIDILSLDKLEVVKGPATLLYGSSAIGGVVNAITGHESAHKGTRGYVTTVGGSNNWQGGGSGGVEYGTDRWLFWGNGSGQRAGNYKTSLGTVANSYTKEGSGSGGAGFYQGKGFFTADYSFDRRRYGIPFDPDEADPEIVFLNPRRHSVSFTGGARELDAFISGLQGSFQYNDYKHQETNPIENVVNTEFKNKTSNYRATFDIRRSGNWSGTFGVSGLHRDYSALGEEAIAPPIKENDFSFFGLEKLDMDRVSFQFGGRFEHNGYKPKEGVVDRDTPDLSFNGLSASAGMRVSTWKDGAFVAYYTHSYRAPTLEELYNEGPHGGNATFEIGDVTLKREQSDGVDFSLRHSNSRARAQFNYFFYHLKDFIFLAPTKIFDDESGLEIANYTQGTSRYTGPEVKFDVALMHGLWLLTALDYVDAKLTDSKTPLPRIPPLRGRLGFEWNYKTLRIAPEAVMSKNQDKLFSTESPTSGYTVFNVNGSYVFGEQHSAQTISVTAFNLGDRVYRNHMSFIKEFAPEIGRGVRLTYAVRFY